MTIEELNSYAADMVVMSPPCQPFTRVGNQKGSADERTKSLLHWMQLLPQWGMLVSYFNALVYTVMVRIRVWVFDGLCLWLSLWQNGHDTTIHSLRERQRFRRGVDKRWSRTSSVLSQLSCSGMSPSAVLFGKCAISPIAMALSASLCLCVTFMSIDHILTKFKIYVYRF